MPKTAVPPPDLEALYQTAYVRLVAVVGAVYGSRADAEDAVQEAFVRLVGRWGRVSQYEDPEAWVRKVALGFASNNRRNARTRLRLLRRAADIVEPVVPEPSGDVMDLRRAVRQLPVAQREALVLHHVLGLDVQAVADLLDVPVGTIKARLARGRAAVRPLLREEGHV